MQSLPADPRLMYLRFFFSSCLCIFRASTVTEMASTLSQNAEGLWFPQPGLVPAWFYKSRAIFSAVGTRREHRSARSLQPKLW